MLQFTDVALRRGGKILFERASFQLHPGQRAALTGANGCGKSSLFALLLGGLEADGGNVSMPDDWVISHVAQESEAGTQGALEYVIDGDQQLRELETKLTAATEADDGHLIGTLHGQIDTIGGYQARTRAAHLLTGLGFSTGQFDQQIHTFSGGWRMRLNLAQALMCRSDLLLLDEPTNHLDLDAVIWLESWLRAYTGTLILISHDRDFIDAVASRILHIEHKTLTLYTGGYSDFEHQRAEKLANQQAAHEKQQREIQHMAAFVARFRAKATKAKQAQSRLKTLERMKLIAPAHIDSPFHFTFFPPRRSPNPLLRLDHADAGYQTNSPILQDLNLAISPGERIGLLGRNGAGKSTLIKLLAGELPPLRGERREARDLNIGYFAQHQLEQLHPEHSALEHLQQTAKHLDNEALEQQLRDFLGGFGFVGDQALSPTEPFSGGEKARLVLALLVWQRPNLLLLDEPTNHLDIEMRLALGNALQDFEGALVVVSHDRHLLRITTDQLLLVHDGNADEFPLSLDEYPRWLASQQSRNASHADGGTLSANQRKTQKRKRAEQRAKLRPLKNRVQQLEKALDELHARQKALETRLADTDLYGEAHKDELKALLTDKANIDRSLGETEEAWLEASDELETLQQDTAD